MPGGKERALRRRIRSVQSTKKITKAMELIAASRILKAQQRVTAARPYTERITEVIGNLAAGGAGRGSPLLEERPVVGTVAYVVITADRGLCGAYNSTVIRAAERSMQRQRAEGRQTRLITVGRKAESYFRFRGWTIDRSFTGFLDNPEYEDARAIAEFVVPRFEDGEYDLIELAYTRFLSAATQRVSIRRFVPLDPAMLEVQREGLAADYEFEPGAQEILDRLLPRYAEARLYAALLEGAASFFAAQQRAMKSATDNAEDLIVKYSRAMNRARQDAITTEIMEIVGGAEAMRAAQAGRDDLLVDHVLMSADMLVDSLPDSLERSRR
ncbi:MAG TPA: F0F1 ATP synthase subunit gamma [Acidimicrobiales bacterium]|nr:F0F1 ATP synthase subunit gamma [Acidimicrobiales bacterium]